MCNEEQETRQETIKFKETQVWFIIAKLNILAMPIISCHMEVKCEYYWILGIQKDNLHFRKSLEAQMHFPDPSWL